MKKKIAGMLAVLLAFSALTGCSTSEQAENTTTDSSAEATTVETVAPTAVPDDINTVVAYVEGQDETFNITFSDWYQEYKFYLLRNGVDETDSYYAETYAQIRSDILDVIMMDRMILKEAELAGVGVNSLTAEELEQLEQTLEESYQTWCESFESEAVAVLGENYTEEELYQKEYELFTDFLAQAGTDTGLFMMWERNNIIQEKLYEVIRQNAGVTDADVEEYIEETINNAKDAYENDLESYESKYTAFYAPEGTRVVEQIFFKFSDTTANEIVAYRNDGDDETADSLLAQAIENELQADIDAAEQALANGEAWDDVQVIYNDDSNGNDSQYVVYPKSTTVDENVTASAMAIAEVGGISEIITTDYGCYLLCYIKDVSISDEEMATMREQCRDYLESLYLQAEVVGWLEKYPYTVNYELVNIEAPEETTTQDESDISDVVAEDGSSATAE